MTPITKLLLNYIEENIKADNELSHSNEHIANALGVNKSSISRCVKELKKLGIITTSYNDDLSRIIKYHGREGENMKDGKEKSI